MYATYVCVGINHVFCHSQEKTKGLQSTDTFRLKWNISEKGLIVVRLLKLPAGEAFRNKASSQCALWNYAIHNNIIIIIIIKDRISRGLQFAKYTSKIHCLFSFTCVVDVNTIFYNTVHG